MTYFVHSPYGGDYRVGVWRDGEWHPGTRVDAMREKGLLGEPGAYVWGKSRRLRGVA